MPADHTPSKTDQAVHIIALLSEQGVLTLTDCSVDFRSSRASKIHLKVMWDAMLISALV